MSRSWSSHAECGVFPKMLWWRESSRLTGSTLNESRTLVAGTSATQALHAARPQLRSGISQDTALVLSNRWFRFGCLPWSLQTGDDAMDKCIVLAQMENGTTRSQPADAGTPDARVALAPARFGKGRLYAFCEQDLHASMRTLQEDAPTIKSWQPWVFAALASHRKNIDHDEYVLAVPENGHVTFLHCRKHWPEQAVTRRFPQNDAGSLASTLQTERLRQSQPFYVCRDAVPGIMRSALANAGSLLPSTRPPEDPATRRQATAGSPS